MGEEERRVSFPSLPVEKPAQHLLHHLVEARGLALPKPSTAAGPSGNARTRPASALVRGSAAG
ncbi:MAG: hypothetical protein M3498_10320 [Deinococcota bacterium]|nr:hypothetical protein [Deinococcota bacterium]